MFVDEYADLIAELRRHALVLLEDDQMIVFDLAPMRRAQSVPAGEDGVSSPQ
jgi:hypothetical protein